MKKNVAPSWKILKKTSTVCRPVSGQYQYPDSSFSMFNFSSKNNDEISTNTSDDCPTCHDSHPVFFAYLLYFSSRNSTFCEGKSKPFSSKVRSLLRRKLYGTLKDRDSQELYGRIKWFSSTRKLKNRFFI